MRCIAYLALAVFRCEDLNVLLGGDREAAEESSTGESGGVERSSWW